MSIARQFGMQGSGKKAADKTAPEPRAELAKPLAEPQYAAFIPAEAKMVDGKFDLMVKVELAGEMKAWGVRVDKAILDLVKRNSKNQTREAEDMILMYAAKMGWK